jgi:hypothetical protein
VDQPLKDSTLTSTSCDEKAELPPISSDKREAKPLSWSESLAQSMLTLATDPEKLAKIEKRAF